MLLLEKSEEVNDFVKERVEVSSDWNMCQTIGWKQGGRIVAGVVFTDYTGAGIVANIAAEPGAYMREFVRAAFSYAFKQLGCRRVTALCAATNTPAHRFTEGLGFQREGLIRCGLPDDDVVIYGILREECRFIEEVH